MRLLTLTLNVIVLAAAGSSALAADKTDGQWRGNGSAALSMTSGNTTTSSVLLTVDAVRATAANKLTLGAMANRATNKTAGVDQTTANKWGGFGQYDHHLSPRTFAFGRLGLDSDQLIDLSLRTALAAGLGYKVIDTEPTTFEVFGGLGYTVDRYGASRTIDGRTDTRFSRASIYLGEASSHKLSASTTFKQRLEVYPGISGDKAVLAKFSAGLAVAINSTMNLTVGLTDTYNSKPPAGTRSNDVGVFTGVHVKFGSS